MEAFSDGVVAILITIMVLELHPPGGTDWLQTAIINEEGRDSRLAVATGKDVKGIASPVFYVSGIALLFVHPWIGEAFYLAVALMWLVPDRRIEERTPA